jgi:hypothetical protein
LSTPSLEILSTALKILLEIVTSYLTKLEAKTVDQQQCTDMKQDLTTCFYIECMSSLRYAVPFVKTVKKLFNISIPLVYRKNKDNLKYNSIDFHEDRLKNISEENDLEIIEFGSKALTCERLFTVENVFTNVKFNSCLSFQHGFDWLTLTKKNKSATYLATDEHFQKQISNFGMKSLIQPIPVVFWDWEYNLKLIDLCGLDLDKKHATLFYPQEGHHQQFSLVYEKLKQTGYNTHIKQRKKHQGIPTNFSLNYYDEFWYPTESIFLPIASDVSIGFETSAYTDLIHINRYFIDFCITSESRDFYKPPSSNLRVMSQDKKQAYEEFCNVKIPELTKEQKLQNPCDYEKIKIFLEQIMSL